MERSSDQNKFFDMHRTWMEMANKKRKFYEELMSDLLEHLFIRKIKDKNTNF